MRNAQTFLRMEKPPLRMGDVPFTDGNAAARTFGRAHRRRPYHFSCGSGSQGCRRGARRWTKTRKGCRRGARRRYSALFIAGKEFAADNPRCLSQERCSPPIIRVVYRRKTVRRRYSALFIAGKQFAADILRCLSQENSSPLHNHKGIVVARCSPLHKHKCIVAARCSPTDSFEKRLAARA